MLDKLFNSSLKIKIMQFCLNSPQNMLTLKEIAVKVKMPAPVSRVVIKQLVALGLLKMVETRIQNKKKVKIIKTYQANTDFVLYPEIRALFLKSRLLFEGDLINKIKKLGGVSLLILTGIFCGLEGGAVDLLIIGKVNRDKLTKIIKSFEKKVEFSLHYAVMSRAEYKYRQDITDRFLYNILENKKIVVWDELTPPNH